MSVWVGFILNSKVYLCVYLYVCVYIYYILYLCVCICIHMHTHMVCAEGIQPCNMKNRDTYWRRYKKHCTQDNEASVPFKVGTLGPHTVLPTTISCPVIFSWIWTVWNFFPKMIFVWGKPEVARHQIWVAEELSHLGDLMFHQKTLHQTWCISRHVVVMKLPITSFP